MLLTLRFINDEKMFIFYFIESDFELVKVLDRVEHDNDETTICYSSISRL